jgi:hypothetical protein
MMIDSAGRAWFGYVDGRIALLDGNIVRVFSPQDGLQVGVVKAIHEHGQHIWIGGEQGLALFDGSRFRTLTADRGPALSGISGIMETASGDLWLNAAPGIIHIPAAEIGRAIETRDYRVHCEIFDYLDGLPGKALPLRPLPGVVASSDRQLWFATTGGIVQVDPDHLTRNAYPPPVFIRSVDSGAKAYAPSADLHLPSRMTSLHIAYTALNFAVPERVRFRYRLEGFDKDWQDAGTRREAFYTNLAPRHYRFHVIACNDDGVWNETGAALEFSILPAFYQTSWFLLLWFAAAGLLVWLVYQWRLRLVTARLNMQFRERLAERTRIARDLHDTLLQGFLSASMHVHVADNHLPRDSAAKPFVAQALELMKHVIDEGRNALKGLRSASASSRSLEQAFSEIGQELGDQLQMEYRVLVQGMPIPLRPAIRDEVYLIGREALANAFRHSQASAIEVELQYQASQLRLLISDNGRGIDSEVLRSGRDGHWGLCGMRERAENIGGKLRVLSGAAAGTEIEVLLPGHGAFEGGSSRSPAGWFSRAYLRKKETSHQQAESEPSE